MVILLKAIGENKEHDAIRKQYKDNAPEFIDEKLLFTDLSYIVQQIYSFTYLSWRSFLPGEKPASMLYSDLISKLLGKMRKVDGWDPDSLHYKLKRKKWFLQKSKILTCQMQLRMKS